MITLATFFTLLRLVLVPGIVSAVLADKWVLAFGTFVAAAITDMLDGAVARWYQHHTTLGACLDVIVDKIFLLTSFAAFAWVSSSMVPAWFVWFIGLKELLLVIGSSIIGITKGWATVRPTLLGKSVTVAQIIFIMWLFACRFFGWSPSKTHLVALGILALLTFSALIHYLIIGCSNYSFSGLETTSLVPRERKDTHEQ